MKTLSLPQHLIKRAYDLIHVGENNLYNMNIFTEK